MLLEKTAVDLKSKALFGVYYSAKELIKSSELKDFVLCETAIEKYLKSLKVSSGTIENHKNKLKNLRKFQSHIGYELNSCNFTLEVAENFKDWFCKKKKTDKRESASRNVSFFACAFNYSMRTGVIKDHSLLNYAGEKDKLSEVVYLNKDELLILEKFNFSNGFLIRVKDLFLFQCYTGLSYMDIWQGWEVLKKGNYFIKGSRGKNKKEYLIPLTDKSIDLLLKYNFRMPKYQNAPYNRAIKEVAMICGIDKNLSSHCARKTFATLQDAKGWSRESISKMLGHSSIKTTERYYLGNSADRIINEFESLAWA